MSAQSTDDHAMSSTEFSNPAIRWIDYRLPIFTFLHRVLHEYPTARNLNYLWTFGSLAGPRPIVAKRQASWQLVPRRENQSLSPLLDLAAAVDDEGYVLAVFHRLDGRTFGGGFDVSDL